MPAPMSHESDSRYPTGKAGAVLAGKALYRDAVVLPQQLEARSLIFLEEQYCKHGQ